ncbi:hypothetical protein BGM25_02880 [Bacillus sp. FJAT-29953]|nr:hypothetical protein [Bacillus sp. FJAT-29953]
MSYDAHITRAEDWPESEEYPITLDELKEYFQTKKDFHYSTSFSSTGPVSLTIAGEFFIWNYGDTPVPSHFWNGRLIVANPDNEILAKMKEIALDLNANLLGDEGESY